MSIRLPELDPIEFLVVRKFPYLKPMTPGFVLPATPYPDGLEAYQENAEAYARELRGLSSDELDSLVEAERAKKAAERTIKADLDENRRSFNRPNTKADFDYWSAAAYWTLDESVALCLGKDPHQVTWESVKSFTKISPFAANYMKLRTLVQRGIEFEQLEKWNRPNNFLAWAKRRGIVYPDELESVVNGRSEQATDWKTLYDELKARFEELTVAGEAREASRNSKIDELTRDLERVRMEALQASQVVPPMKVLKTRERDTVLKLIIGMAVRGYSYNPRANRSDTVSEIVSDLDELGLHLDPDTVRKWLREAAESLPPESDID